MSRTIPYESAIDSEPRGKRPAWVYAVVGVYALVLGGLSLLPFILPVVQGDSFSPPLCATATVLVLCEVALLFVPVRVASRRPITRRSLWIPLLGSGLLAALLALGGGVALLELAAGSGASSDRFMPVVFGTAGAIWLAWTLLFWMMSWRRTPDAVGARLHRWLVAGSVLELLIAVPTHVVVRRREECCAGIATGLGICAGVAVMLIAFGPSVAFLYYRRWKQVRPPRREATPTGTVQGPP